jgi:hypothetical protein
VDSFICINRRNFNSAGDTLSFPSHSQIVGTLCFFGRCIVWDAKYIFPLNFGFKKSGALRFRCKRLNPPFSVVTAEGGDTTSSPAVTLFCAGGAVGDGAIPNG